MILQKLKSLLSQYNNSSLSKNIVTVFSGTALAQFIQVAGSLLLVFYFSPAQFGIFALYVSVSSLLSIVATARYEMAIVLPEKQDESKLLVLICFIITLIVSVLSSLIIYPLKETIAGIFSSDELVHYLNYVPVSVFCTGIFQTLSNYVLREKQFRTLSLLKIFQAASSIICPLIFWYAGFKTGGLILGYVVSQVISATVILLIVSAAGILNTSINWTLIKPLLARYKNFPAINSLHAFTDSAQASAINFIISYCYGNNALGLFSMASRVLKAPMGVISAAVSQVLFQQMSENFNKGVSNYPLTKRTIQYLSAISVPLFLIIAAISPFLFKLFFHPEWTEAGTYIIYLTPWVAALFVSSPLSHLPNITSRQFDFLLIVVVLNLLSFIVLYILYVFHFSLYVALSGFSLTWLLGIIFLLGWFVRLSQKIKKVTAI